MSDIRKVVSTAEKEARAGHIAALQELNLEEIRSLAYSIGAATLALIDEQQRCADSAIKLITLPDIDSDRAKRLRYNTGIYTDEIEDILDTDPVLQAVSHYPSSSEKAEAVRTRRSTVLMILHTLHESAEDSDTSAPHVA